MSDRYVTLGTIAKGGMARVDLGRRVGSAGFSRLVAIKRLDGALAADRNFVAMLVDEARLASQIRHGNVVDTLDLVASDGAFSLVLEYIEGDSLAALLRQARDLPERVPLPIALAILYGVLRGLDAAHEARDEDGSPLGIVHRDVSPQNVLVGVDGIPRIIDFGIAKAMGRLHATRPGELRGKFAYMAPEQLQGHPVTRQVDVYAAGVILWELLAGRRLFAHEDDRTLCASVLLADVPPPSHFNPAVPGDLDAIVLRAMSRSISERYVTARELLAALTGFETASDDEVGAWVRRLAADRLAMRQELIQRAKAPTDARALDEVLNELGHTPDPRSSEPAPPDPRNSEPAPIPESIAAGHAHAFASSHHAPRPSHAKRYVTLVAFFAFFGLLVFVSVLTWFRVRANARHQALASETAQSSASAAAADVAIPVPSIAASVLPLGPVVPQAESPDAAAPPRAPRAAPIAPRPSAVPKQKPADVKQSPADPKQSPADPWTYR